MNSAHPADRVKSLSIVMPYYNEEGNVERSLRGALDYLKARFADFEVVAVDDHSTDRTLALARAIQSADPHVTIVALPQNTRFAGALKHGFVAAAKDYVFYTDGDCPIEFDDIDAALAVLDRYDVVTGYRTTRDQEGWWRRLYTVGYRAVLRALLGLRFRDVNFSFKLFPHAALAATAIESTGSFIDAEILFKLQRAGYRIGEIPVRYHSRRHGCSTLAAPDIILKILRELLAFWWTTHRHGSLPATGSRHE